MRELLESEKIEASSEHISHKGRERDHNQPSVTGLTLQTPNGEQKIQADKYLAACDVSGIKRIIPRSWRRFKEFDSLFKLDAVPVATVQLRYDGWVTEINNTKAQIDLDKPSGLDNLLYTADADFSCFADLALSSPEDYKKDGQGSLLQCVLTPGDPWITKSPDDIVKHTDLQVRNLFPSSRSLKLLWSNVVKVSHSLYREAPGMDPYRPDQQTSFFA